MIVVLYVLDSLRPDFLSCYGFDKKTSPNIDALARDGVLFRTAYTTSSWTKPSGASILTGQYPRGMGMMYSLDVLPKKVTTLPEILGDSGFKCIGLTANGFISGSFGFNRGFDRFFDLWKEENLLERGRRSFPFEVGAAKAKIGVDRWILVQSQDLNDVLFKMEISPRESYFIFIWSMDTHDPYYVRGNQSYFGNSLDMFVPQSEFYKYSDIRYQKALKALYWDMIRHNDDSIGDLVSWLKKLGLYNSSLILITSDHGEAFFEHGISSHGGIVFEEQVKVPLIIKFPGNIQGGTIVHEPVQSIDIFPTLVQSIGCQYPDTLDGISLLNRKLAKERPIFCEYEDTDGNRSVSLRQGRWKWMRVWVPKKTWGIRSLHSAMKTLKRQILRWRWRSPVLYDLVRDPGEQHPLRLWRVKDEAIRLEGMVTSLLSSLEKRQAALDKTEWKQDDKVLEHLRGLGYVD